MIMLNKFINEICDPTITSLLKKFNTYYEIDKINLASKTKHS
jgi:hypothetical protein